MVVVGDADEPRRKPTCNAHSALPKRATPGRPGPLGGGEGDEPARLIERRRRPFQQVPFYRRQERVVIGKRDKVETDDIARQHEKVLGAVGGVVGQARMGVYVTPVDRGGGRAGPRHRRGRDHY